jgi:hypothetical protein
MHKRITSLLKKGAEANYSDKFRRGNCVYLPAEGELIATGDIHGHQRNLERIIKFADLENNPGRHLLLQEIIHGGPEDALGGCLSYKLLFDAVEYKVKFPDRLHFIMANHDTAYINDGQVMKNGKEMNRSMRMAIDREFQERSEDIKKAITNFFISEPLAIRCANRIWLSHSLPSDRNVEKFDEEIFNRPITPEDTVQPGSAYLLTWGRGHNQQTLDKIAQALNVDIFVLGHQRQSGGYSQTGRNLLIISSDHNHGCLLPIDLSKTYTMEQLIEAIVPLASIA